MDLNNQGIDDKNKSIDYKGKLVETGAQDRSTPSKESTDKRFTPESAQIQPISSIDLKDRIFSNTAQPRKLPTYDHVILKDATARSTFFANLHANNPDAKIAVISKIADFAELRLDNDITLERNNFTSKDGILFSKDPRNKLILVIDNSNMQASERAELNQIFDKDARISDKELGSNISVISVIDDNIILGHTKTQQDFGRRAVRGRDKLGEKKLAPTNQEFFERKFTDDSAISIKGTSSKDDNKITINLANKNWKQELFGGPEIDHNGNATLSQGKLAGLNRNQTVVLQNAPWNDSNFNNELRQALTRNYYITNKVRVDIPQNISWHRSELKPIDIPAFKQKFNLLRASDDQNLESFGKALIINDVLFDSYQEGIRINDEGMVVKEDMLAKKLADADSIVISSALKESQWKGLLYHLEDLGKIDIPIIQYNAKEQPFLWYAEKTTQEANITFPKVESKKQINIITDSVYFSKKNTDIKDKVVIELFPDTNPENISYDIEIKNYQTREFQKNKKQVLNAIESGKEIVIIWPDKNPAFVKYMETLLANPPSFGGKLLNNNIKLTIVVSDNADLDFSLWRSFPIDRGFVAPAIETLKTYAQAKYCNRPDDIELYDKMVDQLDILIKSINATLEYKNLDSNKIVFDETIIDKIWIQAQEEMLVNNKKNLSVVEFKKAVNTILLKEFRADLPMYHYFKYITRYYFNVDDNPYFDFAGLRDFTNRNIDNISPEFIENNMWELLKFLPNLSYLAEDKLDIPQTKPAKSKWLIIRFFQAVFNIVVGFFIAAMNWLLPASCFKKDLPIDLHGMPETTLLSMIPNEKYYEITNLLKAALVACSQEKHKQNLKLLLDVSDEAVQKANGYIENWQNIYIKAETTLVDLLYYAKSLGLKPTNFAKSENIPNTCRQYAIEIAAIKDSTASIERKEKQVAKILKQLLPKDLLEGKQGETDKTVITNFLLNDCDESSKEYKQLWVAREARRKARLEMKFKVFSSMFLLGEAGLGKTKRLLDLIKNSNYFIFAGSPNTSTDDLFGINVVETEGDSKKVTFEKHPVLEWAEFRNDPLNPDADITLFIDEGPLLIDGFLETLIRGLTSDIPHISYNGKIIELTKNHKVVIAGNPANAKYDNRHISKLVTRLSATNYLKPLDEEFQYNYITRPKIEAIVNRYDIKSTTANVDVVDEINTRLSFLFKAYSKYLPNDYDITTRDLNESCTLLDTYLWILKERGVLQDTDISIEMLNPIIERIVNGAIGGRIESERWHLEAIKGIYKAKFTVDDSLDNSITEAFEAEYDEIQLDYRRQNQHSTVDFSNKAITKMSYALWVTMKKREKELEEQVAFTGRRYLEIMGDAGIGKDMIVNIFLRHYKNKFQDDRINTRIHNVGPSSWSSVIVPEAKKAFEEGGINAMSEVNIIPSNIFEGEFNMLLACDNTQPGFATIATKNFSHFSARYKPSTAAQSRTTLLYVDNFDSNDLISIAQKQVTEKNAEKIVKLHSKITELLEEYKLSLKPSLNQLDELIAYVKNNPSVSDTDLLKEFEKIYNFYIRICTDFGYGFTEKWQEFSSQIKQGNFNVASSLLVPSHYKQQLSLWLANKFGDYLPEATYVMQGTTEDRFDANNNYIFLSNSTLNKSFEEQQAQVFNLLIDNLWKNYGAPSIDEVDKKHSALYKQWKQKFAAEKIYAGNDNPYLKAELLFPISEKEQYVLDSIDIVRKELLDIIYSSKPDRAHRAKAEIIFEGKNNPRFLTTVIDMVSGNTAIFETLLKSEQPDIAKQLLTNALRSDNLTTQYLQKLIKIFDSYPEQLTQIISYLNQEHIEKYYLQRQSRKELEQLVASLESHNMMQQQKFNNIIENIKSIIEIYKTKLEEDANNDIDTSNYQDSTITQEEGLASYETDNPLYQFFSENKSSKEEGFFSKLLSKGKDKLAQVIVNQSEQPSDPEGKIGTPLLLRGLLAGATIPVKAYCAYGNNRHKKHAKSPVPFNIGKYLVNDGIKYRHNQTPDFPAEEKATLTNEAILFFDKTMEKTVRKALGFFDSLEQKDTVTINIVETIRSKAVTRKVGVENWFTTEQILHLLKYDNYNVKKFILCYLSLQDCKEYNLNYIIANELLNSKLETDQVFEILNFLFNQMNTQYFIFDKNRKFCVLMSICGELLECCLNNLQKNKNLGKTKDVLESLLTFKFLNNNLSAKGANALATIRKLNIEALNEKIDRLLNNRYERTLTHQLDIDHSSKKPKPLEGKIDDEFKHYLYDDSRRIILSKNETNKNLIQIMNGLNDLENQYFTSRYGRGNTLNDSLEDKEKRYKEYTERFLENLKQRTSPHIEEKTKKLMAFKSVQNWSPSNKIHLINLIHGNAPFEHDQKYTKQVSNVFISGLPIIISKDTMHVFYHKQTGTIINLGELLTSGENPISDDSITNFLKKHKLPNPVDEYSEEFSEIKFLLDNPWSRRGPDSALNILHTRDIFNMLSPEDISKAIYSKMLETFGSLTFCISASNKKYNGFTTVTTETELQNVIDHHLTLENIQTVDFNGLQNAEFSEDTDESLLKHFEKKYGTQNAFFTTNDMQKVAHEILNQ